MYAKYVLYIGMLSLDTMDPMQETPVTDRNLRITELAAGLRTPMWGGCR